RLGETPHRAEPEIGPRRARLDQPQEIRVERDHREVHAEIRRPSDPGQEIAVARDGRRLGRDPDTQAGNTGRRLEHAARDREPSLRGLIGIGGGADRDLLGAVAGALEVREEPRGIPALDVDALLELLRVRMAEVFVSWARVAVAAAELAAAER